MKEGEGIGDPWEGVGWGSWEDWGGFMDGGCNCTYMLGSRVVSISPTI